MHSTREAIDATSAKHLHWIVLPKSNASNEETLKRFGNTFQNKLKEQSGHKFISIEVVYHTGHNGNMIKQKEVKERNSNPYSKNDFTMVCPF